ncbi:SprT-like domain-containing protein [Candidatus Gracilibacteria bacterium]|nr:SprT-like domain-containing protein [Candidatus Gracilibacteria bacterium]
MDILIAQNIAQELLRTHGLLDWEFRFDRAKYRFGYCNYTKKIISISRILTELNTESKVRDTILHEIAHALVGKTCGHGKIWKEKSFEIGACPKRCFQSKEVVLPKRKYTVRCDHCQKEYQVAKKRFRVACGDCCQRFNSGKYSPKFSLRFIKN